MADNGSDDGRKRAADQNDDTVPSPKRTKGVLIFLFYFFFLGVLALMHGFAVPY